MSSNIDSMTEEERHAFRAYIVPDPVCIKSHEEKDSSVSRKMKESFEANDTFVIRGAGRLESSPYSATKHWKNLEHAKKFNIAIMDIPVLNSRSSSSNELMRYIVSDILLQLHACIDQGKKEYLQNKVMEGIQNARKKGVQVGRRPKKRPEEFDALKEEWARGEISSYKAAERLGVSHMTFLRWAREQ